MIVIYAEKGDLAQKIAAALDKITLDNGTVVTMANLEKYQKAVKAQQNKDGFLNITFQGEECNVIWGFGHLCALKQAKDYDPSYKKWSNIPIPFFPDPFEIKFNEQADEFFNKRNKKQFDTAKRLFPKAKYIINATDDDREGEVIFAYLYEILKCKTPVKRVLMSSMTANGLKTAFNNLVDHSTRANIQAAGKARGIADWVVGSNLTASISLKNPGAGVLSVGRVQTPTLNILVERTLAIKNFNSSDYYTVDAEFTTSNNETYKATHSTERFDKKSDADKVFADVNGKSGVITNVVKKKYEKEIPYLYNLSALQMDASSKYGFTLQETLDTAQALYDGGYTTYPRTSSQYLNEDKEPGVNAILDRLATMPEYKPFIDGKSRVFDKPHWFDDSKVVSHFAIIPTGKLPKALGTKEEKVYDLIAKSVIRMIYKPAVLERTTITTTVNNNDFIASGSTIIDEQWICVGDKPKEAIFPVVNKNDKVTGKYEENAKKTSPPKNFTDKSLVSAMIGAGKTLDDAALKKILNDPRVEGIGTEATRAGIVETLIKRGYAARKGKNIFATDKGIEVINSIPIDDFKSAEMTAKWEQRLLNIELGKDNYDSFIKDIEASVTKWCGIINSSKSTIKTDSTRQSIGKCPVCGGDIIKHKWGCGCSEYKNGCKFAISSSIASKKITDKNVQLLITKGETPLIKGFKSKAGKSFDAILKVNGEKIEFEFPAKSN